MVCWNEKMSLFYYSLIEFMGRLITEMSKSFLEMIVGGIFDEMATAPN